MSQYQRFDCLAQIILALETSHLDQIILSIPSKDRTNVKCLTNMKDVWDVLDLNYGRKDDAALCFIDKFEKLHIDSHTDHHKFVKFYKAYKATKFNLEEISHLDVLKESHAMQAARTKIPGLIGENFAIAYTHKKKDLDETDWKILNDFIEEQIEISHQRVSYMSGGFKLKAKPGQDTGQDW